MPTLSNARHERFAQGLAKGKTQTDAYTTAGYRGDVTAASRLSRNVKIQDRVAELQERAADFVEMTIAELLGLCRDIVREARASEDFSAASATVERAAKIAGLWVDQSKLQSSGTVAVYSAEPMTADEWEAEHAQLQ